MSGEIDLPEKSVPDKILVPEWRAKHQDIAPRFATDGLGGVPQGVIAGQVAEADDPQGNGQQRQENDGPDRQGNVSFQRIV